MRRLIWGLAICFLSIPLMYGQQRPTLGPPEPGAPSLQGPRSVRTDNAKKLLKMRTIYIHRISHSLNEILTRDFSHVVWLKVVNKPSEANAIVRGSCYDLKNLKRLHTEVYINDRITGASIWQDVIRVPYKPPDLSKAVDEAAAQVLSDLHRSIERAGNR